MYKSPTKEYWQGSTDPLDGEKGHRWHHVVKMLDLSSESTVISSSQANEIAFLGFCCDEGVRRNAGRVGARNGSAAIRISLANLAVHFEAQELVLHDAGDVICQGEHMEATQEMLGKKVSQLLERGYRPIVLGGGHEMAYGHFLGIHASAKSSNQRVGIINFDAHFDLKNYNDRGDSGTPFLQIAELLQQSEEKLEYLVLGINEAANTKAQFQTTAALGVKWITAEAITEQSLEHVKTKIDHLHA